MTGGYGTKARHRKRFGRRAERRKILVSDNAKIRTQSPSSKDTGSWTVLVIGELGNILSFAVTKRLIIGLGVGVVGLLAFGILSSLHYFGMRSQTNMLKSDLAKMEAELAAANKARETALVRLSVLESGAEPGEKATEPSSQPQPAPETPHKGETATPRTEDAKPVVSSGAKPVAETPSDKRTQPSQPTRPVSSRGVSIETLEMWQEVDEPTVRFQFILKNTDSEGRRVKGYTFVALRPAEGMHKSAAVFPSALLKEGKPSPFEKGQYFSILRFKSVTGGFPHTQGFEGFERATVYVYSGTGELLLEEAYSLERIRRP